MYENISNLIKKYKKERQIHKRYTSFDYCYNYFCKFFENDNQDQLKSDENLELSCLHLGFYLASWGMFRSPLIKKSLAYYKDIIVEISNTSREIWKIDIDSYSEDNIKKIIECKENIEEHYGNINERDNRTSKIMLGVFGNVPAYDKYFKEWLGDEDKKDKFCQTFNKKSLQQIKRFYEKNKEIFEKYDIKTLDFSSEKETKNISYPNIKLVDMYGYMYGKNKED